MFQYNTNFGTTTTDQQKIDEYIPPSPQNITTMPNPTSWDIHDLNWNFDGVTRQNHNITHFTAFTTTSPTTTTVSGKRKTIEPPNCSRPSKQFISEQKMIEHLNSMHLSSSFTNHNISPDKIEDSPYKVFFSPADLEEKLKNAQRITVCEQIKNLTKDDPLLPKALLNRASTSSSSPYCNALVLWQPPSQILKVYDKDKEDNENEKKEEEKSKKVEIPLDVNHMDSDEMFMDNNNSSSIDYNNIPVMSEMDFDDL